jgi:hypothetical protein
VLALAGRGQGLLRLPGPARPGDEDRKPDEGKPKDPVPPRREGLNRFVWDGRHGRGTQIEIDPPEDEDAAANLGPSVPPGRYTVRVEQGGQEAGRRGAKRLKRRPEVGGGRLDH